MKTKILSVHSEYPELDLIVKCAQAIRQGKLVVFPTETVYGLGADATNEKAIQRLREIKRRPQGKPFSILVSEKENIDERTSYLDCSLYKLIDKFWPGPLTIIVPARQEGKTIGLRMPQNTIALSLVQAAGCSIAAPSANIHGGNPPVTCQEALKQLDGLVDIAIDGGPSLVAQESSIVDLTSSEPEIIREGPITREDIIARIGKKTILFVCTGNSCRSVMAEFLLKKMLGPQANVEVISAGVGVYVSMPASEGTIKVLKKEGIDASMHRAQPITKTMVKKADLILVMSESHRQQILALTPYVEKRMYLLKEFANIPKGGNESFDIVDPIGKPYEIFEECFWVIKEAIKKIVNLV